MPCSPSYSNGRIASARLETRTRSPVTQLVVPKTIINEKERERERESKNRNPYFPRNNFDGWWRSIKRTRLMDGSPFPRRLNKAFPCNGGEAGGIKETWSGGEGGQIRVTYASPFTVKTRRKTTWDAMRKGDAWYDLIRKNGRIYLSSFWRKIEKNFHPISESSFLHREYERYVVL